LVIKKDGFVLAGCGGLDVRCCDLIVVASYVNWTYIDIVDFSVNLKINRCLRRVLAVCPDLCSCCWRFLATALDDGASSLLEVVAKIYKYSLITKE
jgi:hypothetical protein